jgi:hypothetical protein
LTLDSLITSELFTLAIARIDRDLKWLTWSMAMVLH